MTSLVRIHRSQRGQVAVIFALVITVVLGLIGLAVDAGFAYSESAKEEKAASAAALAGVTYMPAGFSTTATTTALAISARNGFKDGDNTGGRNISVTVSKYPQGCGSSSNPCSATTLTVTITETVPTYFMRMFGIGSTRIQRSSSAFYLGPIALGQPGSQVGSSLDKLGVTGQNGYYVLRHEGWGTNRSEGDAYTPDPVNENICGTNVASYGTSTDLHAISEQNGNEVTNATLASSYPQFWRLPTRGGYNYTLSVPSNSSLSDVRAQVYNPVFAPDGGYVPSGYRGGNYTMHEDDSFNSGNPRERYSKMMYTLFRVVDSIDQSKDVPLVQMMARPLNAYGRDGSGNPTFSDPTSGSSVSQSTAAYVYHAWVDLAGPSRLNVYEDDGTPLLQWAGSAGSLAAGQYRLRVDTLDWQGLRPVDDSSASLCSQAHKGYATRLTQGANTVCASVDANCSLGGLGDFGIFTPVDASAGTFDVPLFYVPKEYAGLDVYVYVYDPGDLSGSGDVSISIVNPLTGAPVTARANGQVGIYDLGVSKANPPSQAVNQQYSCTPQADLTVATVVSKSNACGQPYNSHWVRITVPIPSSYNPGPTDYWRLRYTTTGTAVDTITLAVGFGGQPVHLLP